MPQARHALYAQGEDLHVSVWPGNPRNTVDIARFLAIEGRVFSWPRTGCSRSTTSRATSRCRRSWPRWRPRGTAAAVQPSPPRTAPGWSHPSRTRSASWWRTSTCAASPRNARTSTRPGTTAVPTCSRWTSTAVADGRRRSPLTRSPARGGAPGRIRTPDLADRSRLLCPLSYGRATRRTGLRPASPRGQRSPSRRRRVARAAPWPARGPMATCSVRTASRPPPSCTPAGSRASGR